jgi:hypothetical protein
MGFLDDVGGFIDDVGSAAGDLTQDVFGSGGSPAAAGGNGYLFQDLIARLEQMAEGVARCEAVVAGAAAMSWQGEAADAFRQQTQALTEQFAEISSDLNRAAGYAGTLASAQGV